MTKGAKMIDTVKLNTLNDEAGECSMDEAIELTMKESQMEFELESWGRSLKWAKEQIMKQERESAERRQAGK